MKTQKVWAHLYFLFSSNFYATRRAHYLIYSWEILGVKKIRESILIDCFSPSAIRKTRRALPIPYQGWSMRGLETSSVKAGNYSLPKRDMSFFINPLIFEWFQSNPIQQVPIPENCGQISGVWNCLSFTFETITQIKSVHENAYNLTPRPEKKGEIKSSHL